MNDSIVWGFTFASYKKYLMIFMSFLWWASITRYDLSKRQWPTVQSLN